MGWAAEPDVAKAQRPSPTGCGGHAEVIEACRRRVFTTRHRQARGFGGGVRRTAARKTRKVTQGLQPAGKLPTSTASFSADKS